MSKIIAVFSIGQFISSDVNLLKQGFTDYFREKKINLDGEAIWNWMVNKNLDPLRVADITLEQFCQRMNEHFEINVSFEDFEKNFKSMAVVKDGTKEQISAFTHLLNENKDFQFLLVSHTNHCHLNFIIEQIANYLPKHAVMVDSHPCPADAQIIFVPSMSSKSPQHPGTLKYALERLKPSPVVPVISFLNTIKQWDHPNFQYVDAGPSLNYLAVTAKLKEVQAQVIKAEDTQTLLEKESDSNPDDTQRLFK